MKKNTLFIAAVFILVLMIGAVVTLAQSNVTDDDVNTVASKLYCPVCENIPLDVCGTAACQDWRHEIRLQLESGQTEQQIITDFIHRFGERVVGTPQDPALRALSLVTPWIILALGILITIWMLFGRSHRDDTSDISSNGVDDPIDVDSYRSLLEQDISE